MKKSELIGKIVGLGRLFRRPSVASFGIGRANSKDQDGRRVRMEMEELRTRTGYLRAVLETMGDAMFVAGADGIIQMANRAALEISKMPIELILGSSIFELIEITPEAIDAALQNGGASNRIEARLRRSDYSVALVSVAISVMRNTALNPSGLVFLIHDLTGMRELQDQLLQAQKLEAVGTLAAGIAHEINTPIQYVGDNTQYLSDAFKAYQSFFTEAEKELKFSPEQARIWSELFQRCDLSFIISEVPRSIEQTLDGVRRVARIVKAMKEFAHPDGAEKVSSDINRLIDSTATISRNEWKYRARLNLELDQSLPLVKIHPGEFNQVILNLIVNAADAIEERYGSDSLRGEITVRSQRAADAVVIQVIDNGTGIPEHVRSKIFEPFFTTKAVGKGTGQGLAIVRSCVEGRLKGKILVESVVGQGTTMTIRLPL